MSYGPFNEASLIGDTLLAPPHFSLLLPLHMHTVGFNMGMLSKYEEAVQTKLGQYTAEGHSACNRAADLTKFGACHAKQHGVWKTLALKAASNMVRDEIFGQLL